MSVITVGQGRGRKPVSLVAHSAKGRLSGRDAIWAQIRQQRIFTIETIWQKLGHSCGAHRKSIASYLQCLKAGGYVGDSGRQRSGADGNGSYERVYQLVKDCGIEAPRLRKDGSVVTQGARRENMWRAMRIIGEFDFRDLALAASTEEFSVKEENARDYIRHLKKAGYLAVTKQAIRGRHPAPARYRLLPSRYYGPKPPQIQRQRQVFDPNINQVVWHNSEKNRQNGSHQQA